MKDAVTDLLIGLVILVLATFFAYRWGVDEGAEMEKEVWEVREQGYRNAETKLRADHAKEIQRVLDANHQTNVKNSHDFQIALQEKDRLIAAARADADRRGGLRIPANPTPVCRSEQGAAAPQAQSTGNGDEASTGTVALPQPLQDSLWSLISDAEAVSEQLRSCQAWIKDNGFY